MKNDIDDILDAMYRGGRLNLSKAEGEISQTAKIQGVQAEKAVQNIQQSSDKLSRSLQKSIEQLTRDAKADMEELDRRLEQDGAKNENIPVGNFGTPENVDAAFTAALVETNEKVIGQGSFVSELAIAFKRPFVAGFTDCAPMGKVAVLGKCGSGRHSALETMTASLARLGVIKSPKISSLELSRYGDASSSQLFIQDFYSAVKSGASVILFENYEKCTPAVISLVAKLFKEGSIPLSGRYAEQKGMLVDIGTALVPGTISSISAAGKYVFLITENSAEKLADAFGALFLAALDDICRTEDFTSESLEQIADAALKELCARAESKLKYNLSYGPQEVEALAGKYRPDKGVAAINEQTEALYKAIGEYKLRNGDEKITVTIVAENGNIHLKGKKDSNTFSIELVEAVATQDAVAAVKQKLDDIIGLKTVKEYILSLEDNFKIQQLRKEQGMKADIPSMHMIFTGNPGTGKTTMARIVSRYLKAIGVLTGGQLIEVTRADLVGKYVGHTAPLTQKAISSALGGVLFIDEAYSLFRGKDDSFGLECIDTLVKCMEDYRDELVVILAGYSREMEEFLTANSGLKSRFPNIIEFPDYTAGELLEITKAIVKGKGYILDPTCDEPLLRYYEQAQKQGDPRTNGNGRMARNKVEEAVIACSGRSVREEAKKRNLELLLPQDFTFKQK